MIDAPVITFDSPQVLADPRPTHWHLHLCPRWYIEAATAEVVAVEMSTQSGTIHSGSR